MLEVYGSHSGEHILELVLECLSSYGLNANQIYCLTNDNVSSILKSVQLLMATEEEEDDVEIDFDEPATYKHKKEEENFI